MSQIIPSDNRADDNDALDYRETPLNACSLETFCLPKDREPSSSTIPLCLGCYQLNESTGKREGRLDLYAANMESFGTIIPPLTVFGGGDNDDDDDKEPAPGVLDGKWSNHFRYKESGGGFQNYYATAHANGEIWVHQIQSSSSNSTNPQQPAFEASLAGKSASPSSKEGLCLALAWESPLYSSSCDETDTALDTRIISSYSDGHTAIHRVKANSNSNETAPLELELEHHWDSHTMFGCPAEVWCANFIDSNTVVTGGDEASWKVWDLRQALTKPVYHGKDDFGAGVTVLAPHPQNPCLLAVGSYDETVAIFDLRKSVSSNNNPSCRPQKVYHSESLGGGIWRCKWHPFDSNKLLVAAMHGGCVVGEFEGLSTTSASLDVASNVNFSIQKEFKLHKSMAYGIDWLTSGSSGMETAASCSFYDKAMYLWKTSGSD